MSWWIGFIQWWYYLSWEGGCVNMSSHLFRLDDICAVRLGCICKSLSHTDIYAEPDTIHSFNPALNERTPRLDSGTTRKIMGSPMSETDRPPWAPHPPKANPKNPHVQVQTHHTFTVDPTESPPPHSTATNPLSREQTSNAGAPFYRCCVSTFAPLTQADPV